MKLISRYLRIIRQQTKPVRFLISRILMATRICNWIYINRADYILRFHPSAFSASIWVNKQERDNEAIFLKRYISSGDTVIDVGANIGSISLSLLSVLGPRGHILAIEPHPRIFSFLKDNIRINKNSDCIVALNIALGGKEGMENFSDISDDSQNHIVCGSERVLRVPIKRLDSIAPSGEIALLKIDVEGYEPEVLRGAEEICARTKIIYLECIPRLLEKYGWSEERLSQFISQLGFNIYEREGKKIGQHIIGNREKKMLFCVNQRMT